MPSYLTRKTSNKFYEGLLLLILLPIIGFSLYKYGYLDYSKGLVSLLASFKVLWLLLINIIITVNQLFLVFMCLKNESSVKDSED